MPAKVRWMWRVRDCRLCLLAVVQIRRFSLLPSSHWKLEMRTSTVTSDPEKYTDAQKRGETKWDVMKWNWQRSWLWKRAPGSGTDFKTLVSVFIPSLVTVAVWYILYLDAVRYMAQKKINPQVQTHRQNTRFQADRLYPPPEKNLKRFKSGIHLEWRTRVMLNTDHWFQCRTVITVCNVEHRSTLSTSRSHKDLRQRRMRLPIVEVL